MERGRLSALVGVAVAAALLTAVAVGLLLPPSMRASVTFEPALRVYDRYGREVFNTVQGYLVPEGSEAALGRIEWDVRYTIRVEPPDAKVRVEFIAWRWGPADVAVDVPTPIAWLDWRLAADYVRVYDVDGREYLVWDGEETLYSVEQLTSANEYFHDSLRRWPLHGYQLAVVHHEWRPKAIEVQGEYSRTFTEDYNEEYGTDISYFTAEWGDGFAEDYYEGDVQELIISLAAYKVHFEEGVETRELKRKEYWTGVAWEYYLPARAGDCHVELVDGERATVALYAYAAFNWTDLEEGVEYGPVTVFSKLGELSFVQREEQVQVSFEFSKDDWRAVTVELEARRLLGVPVALTSPQSRALAAASLLGSLCLWAAACLIALRRG